MNKLLKKIYENVIYYEEDAVSMGKRIDSEINKIIDPYRESLSKEEAEELKNMMCQTSLVAEQEGFQLGISYAVKIFMAGSSD